MPTPATLGHVSTSRRRAARQRIPRRVPPAAGRIAQMDLVAFDALATSLAGVRRTNAGGAARWQLHGRLVARELDATHVVVRVPFDVRDGLLRRNPDVFSLPRRFEKHMMVVADLDAGDDGAVEDALEAAWTLQQEAGPVSG
jgi:hypothetical protein